MQRRRSMTFEIFLSGLLRAVGAFYAIGSLIVLWSTLTSALAERAQAAIEARPLPSLAVWRTWWLAASALLLLASGLALALLLNLAMPLFVLSAAGQAFYLTILAPRSFDLVEPPDEAGRSGTRNALLVLLVATALVLVAWSAGWLLELRTIPPAIRASAVGLVLFASAYVVSNLRDPQ
jgi:hypothetical protein